MAKADLYSVTIKSADTSLAASDFIKAQKQITAAARRDIRRDLAEKNLSAEFAFAAKKISSTARSFQLYATPAAAGVIGAARNVDRLERLPYSAYPLTKDL